MAIQDNGTRNQYTATASQTVFAYTFEVFDSTDLTVEQNGAVITAYTVSGVGVDAGGNVTLTTGATAGDIITIYRSMPLVRTSDYAQNGEFLAAELNTDLDRIIAMIQQSDTTNGSAIRALSNDTALDNSNTTLANVATRAGKSFGFDSNGLIEYKSVSVVDGDTKYTTKSIMKTDTSAVVGTTVYVLSDRANGIFDTVTKGVTPYIDLPDGESVIASTADPTKCFVLRKDIISASQFGSIQAAIDYSIANNYETITIDRLFDQTGITLLIDKGLIYTVGANDFARKRITFIGVGNAEIRKPDTGFMFSATSGRNGDIAFENITFSGNVEVEFPTVVSGLNCFNCDNLIRVSTTNCVFRNFDYCWYQTGTTSAPMQSVKSTNDTYTKNNIILHFNQVWDVVFNGGLMEDGNQFLTCVDVNSATRNLIVNNGCTIEGMIDTAIELNCVNYGTKIVNSYFEANQNHIQMNRYNFGVSISDNSFLGRGNIDAGDSIRCIDIAVGAEPLTVSGNVSTETTANTTLIYIDETSAFNVSRNNIMGTNGVLGSAVLTNTPNRYINKQDISNDTTRGIESGITADVSSAQGGSLLTATINEISTCANVGDSVTLLPAASGLKQTIINNGANACDVFPNTGDNLGVGANSPVSLAAGANITYVCWDFATNWVALT